ncbi:hypothetical protein CDQ84_16190 [Clostridium thermosuccinogenes]|uniref:DUF4179 domain-containing protein n=1 Tax=Clostridium thermosuccinogenes TaxID=84032 RepID=A0A2K2EVP2_9CLOT|nr:hypothetical protein [Pseudoclostridium thermosuccinogenes]AUS95354.1 hypothetical protein CDO33_02195 [Pseudoclostridium thermosuccinogenes]PNT90588.1 hypothetical protein CDQ83_18240 [Pseudoclostridium thermosuccinogenes]PNT94851.1 hypothetical protein CDQ85_16855 [Pseudoclostridium thermosuccinogenes]PNT95901.1 hypothetical protein CDQ84_16190 [Pseudoclostridium thermosuccinogenes]
MDKNEQLEKLLKQALSSTAEPSEALNLKIKYRIKERKAMKPVRRRIAVALIAAFTLIMSGSAFAAWKLLSPKQVAENFGDKTLAKAFDSENAVQINKSVTSGDYTFTLLGMTSGKNLSDFKSSVQDIHPDRTYAVVSIERKDGSPIPAMSDENYNEPPFIVSPLIKGQKPWQVNIFTMNGGYSECVVDGVIYRMIECDSIEMFADRGVYLYAGIGSFIDNQTVSYNEETGEITLNANNKEAGALFELPLDVKKADHEKAEQYLKDLLNPASESITGDETVNDSEYVSDWGSEFANGIVIPESIKEVTYDENGLACYEYNGSKVGISLDFLFKDGEAGVWKIVSINGDGEDQIAIQFMKDENGVVTGRAVKKAK